MSASPSGASRRTVTVLFCDIVDSTPLGEALDPEPLRHVMTAYYDAVRGVLERHGGTVEKFIGDAAMAVFGIPTVHEDDALRAVRAARELPEAAAAAGVRVRVGVATGEVVAEDPSAGHGFVTGETVVTAERLEGAARAGEALIDDVTYRLVADAVDAEPIEPVAAKGKAEPVAAWRLLGVRPGALGVARRFGTPLVDRVAELAALRGAFELTVAERRCRLVTVLGPAGIGKSRLVREFLFEQAPRATVRVGSCPPYGDGITFWPIAEVLPGETLEGSTDEIFWRVRKQFEQLARERPLVLSFEDVHWAEPTFLNLVDYLQGWIADAPLLVVCLARQELLEQRPEWRSGSLTLPPLSGDEAESFLDALDVPSDSRRRIAEAAEGNPLFAEQMAAMAADAGAEFVVPPSIRVLLGARLDRLSAEERVVVERAAVIGREFPLRAVAALVPEEARSEVADHLLSLVRKDLVEPHALAFANEDGFRFRHGLIREAAYDGMPKALRADLHERYAGWFERNSGEDVIVGYHLEQAYRALTDLGLTDGRVRALGQRAGTLLAAAGRRAAGRGDAPAAVAMLRRATAVLEPDDPSRRGLLLDLAESLMRSGRLAEAEPVLDEASESAQRAGDRRVELRAAVERQLLREFSVPEGTAALRVAEAVIPELEQLGDDRGLAKAWWLLSEAHLIACRWEARTEALDRALEHAGQVPEAARDVSAIVAMLAQALHYGPTPADRAIVRCRELLDDWGDDQILRAGVYPSLGALLAMQGDFVPARELYRSSAATHEELGLPFRRAASALLGAEIEVLAGDVAAAEQELRDADETLAAMGETGVRAVVAADLSAILCDRHADEEAASFAELAARLSEPADLAAHVPHRLTSARILARRGRHAEAERVAREAVRLARGTDFVGLQASACVGLAEVAAAAGAVGAARHHLEQARSLLTLKGNEVGVRRVEQLLSATAVEA